MYGQPQLGVSVVGTPMTPGDPCIDALENQQYVTPWPYYSTVKFRAPTADAAPGPFTYTIAAGVRARAFAYAVGDAMAVAGFTAADGVATIAETNLTSRSETTSGENVIIHGLAVQILPALQDVGPAVGAVSIVRQPDQQFLSALFADLAVSIGLNGDANLHRLGTLGMLPGAGGLSGGGQDIAGPLQVAGQTVNSQLFPANGWPVRSNFFPLPEGLIWKNKGNADSTLNVIFETVRAINILSGGSPENNIAGIGADLAFNNAVGAVATAQGYLYPTELIVGLKVFLIGSIVGPRSRDQ